jgi:hypothetical protein
LIMCGGVGFGGSTSWNDIWKFVKVDLFVVNDIGIGIGLG